MTSLSISMRPSRIEDVVGHGQEIKVMQQKIAEGRIPRAILLVGSPGVGKTTLALIFARMLQGDSLPEGQDPEIREINAADDTGIEATRALVDSTTYRPMQGRYRVVVMNEAQKLTSASQECLLIPTEAEESSTVWVFTTTDATKILPALQTRCLRFDLKGLSRDGIEILVTRACDALSRKWTAVDDEFVAYMALCKVNSPRPLLMAYEKFASGTPLKEVISDSAHEPLYADVAKAVLRGDWNATRGFLEQIKTPDVRGLRSVVTAFLGNALVRSEPGPKADALATCLMGMGVAYEDGVAYAQTKGALYKVCRAISGGK